MNGVVQNDSGILDDHTHNNAFHGLFLKLICTYCIYLYLSVLPDLFVLVLGSCLYCLFKHNEKSLIYPTKIDWTKLPEAIFRLK